MLYFLNLQYKDFKVFECQSLDSAEDWKELDEFNGSYKGTAAQKPHFGRVQRWLRRCGSSETSFWKSPLVITKVRQLRSLILEKSKGDYEDTAAQKPHLDESNGDYKGTVARKPHLDESNGDYKDTTARKLQFECSDNQNHWLILRPDTL